ncbi:uncharacterized protein TRUGW13939_00498 [Talaromyces rugulosus]|uniref:Uncharacterized protein n=1 Tax=Talaromyces rugulosus TaxID=121627 RepID=A0A7H8QHG9_TALRU|nr:uncharacterized protein TRUGW13939_00498 [Talaromyces rugulosus]QKX53419.1 hypothetical protein TRUGW13939_00498 [Talaromyces rugulosus]
MHKPSIAEAVHNATFPRPKSNDPTSFEAHIKRNLVPEVRMETSMFYGSLDCIEAQYPGLDYSYGPHRMRLGRFPWHRKLFRVFDDLGLTKAEIAFLCRWEGTKSARERYEKEEGTKVRDTTADGVRPATPSPGPIARFASDEVAQPSSTRASTVKEEAIVKVNPIITDHLEEEKKDDDEEEEDEEEEEARKEKEEEEDEEEEESSDEEMESYGLQLNQRLLYATAARERGANVPMDEDWEQWLKEAVERGNYSDMLDAIRTGQPVGNASLNPSSPIPANNTALLSQLAISARQSVSMAVAQSNRSLQHASSSASSTAR